MPHVTFVRHAQSVTNAGERWPDPYTIPLSELGKLQAESLSLTLPTVETVLHSAMIRTRQTIEPYLARYPESRSMMLSDLNEMRDLNWRNLVDATSAGIRAELAAWWADPDPHATRGGEESFAGMHARACRVISSLEQCGFERVIVVTHANYLRLLKCLLERRLLGTLAEQKAQYWALRRDMYVPNAGVCHATWDGTAWVTTEFT